MSHLEQWPMSSDGRYLCTPDRPMPDDVRKTFGGSGLWKHTDAEDIGTCLQDCCTRYKCRACGITWLGGGDA